MDPRVRMGLGVVMLVLIGLQFVQFTRQGHPKGPVQRKARHAILGALALIAAQFILGDRVPILLTAFPALVLLAYTASLVWRQRDGTP